MSYFFVTTLQVFFCIALLSGVLWSRNDPPSLRPLTWTLLTGLIAGVLAGLFIHGSQPVQLLLVGAEVMVSLLFVLSFWWASTRIRYLWQGILIFGAARHWALDPNLGGLTSTHVLNTDLLLNLTAVVLAFAILCLAGVLCAMLLRRIRGLYWPLTLILLVMIWLPLSGNLLLLLMKLQVVPLGKSLLSFVAKVTNNTALYETQRPRKVFDTISDNAANAGVILGGRPIKPDELDLRWISALMYRNGVIEETGVAAGVLNHPANGVAWLANKLAPYDVQLEAGQIILGGSFTRPVPARKGDTFHVDYGNMGSISCRFV